ncbi:MAG: FAD-dependent monooxygenase [Bacteroidota bacterium]
MGFSVACCYVALVVIRQVQSLYTEVFWNLEFGICFGFGFFLDFVLNGSCSRHPTTFRSIISQRFDILIIGGGPAGSSAAIELALGGMNVAVAEKRSFPREVLCGEFLSGEVARAIRHFGLYDEFLALRPHKITTFTFTPENDLRTTHPLGFEAWALKRSLLDHMLLKKAEAVGATVIQPAEVISIEGMQGRLDVQYRTPDSRGSLTAATVIAAYGKQNLLDKSLKRNFVSNRSGLSGVKYHVHRNAFREFPDGDIRIFASQGIYCGINRISEDEATLCFLADQSEGDRHPTDALARLLRNNKGFRALFREDLLLELKKIQPFGTGNIFFGRKNVIENGMYMIGDAAAVIAPLAGDGIGMAIESGQLVARVLTEAKQDSLDRQQTETLYTREWKRLFGKRLAFASFSQGIAMNSWGGNAGGWVLRAFPQIAKSIIRGTRGNWEKATWRRGW